MTFSKILIANRGEIACRVIRTARALGYRTVAVHSDADAGALHVAQADEAVRIGPAPVGASYLSADRILDACRATGADAVHPGYGFLSENAAFADACVAAGVTFIGPPADAIRRMGNKAEAKRLMIAAGVPCVPGYQGEDQRDETLVREGERVGFPLMVKAAAGGGGRGMRVVHGAADLSAALASARSEAANAFGSDELILERAVVRARHVEVQVFADTYGNTIHLGERDCSVQRRHQKVLEEAPCPVMTPELRDSMGAAAVAAARAVGYVGAGTVEFLLAEDGAFYFLEMNTRLQVEHPVTELVTGFDLVAWQLDVAAGAPLPIEQDGVALTGHAIEARLYAEDPAAGFLPQTGRVLAWRPPAGEGVRVDHGLGATAEISPYYDPMVAKVIAWGRTRDEALRRLGRALEDAVFLGTPSNKAFLVACLRHRNFASGHATTAFIPDHAEELVSAAGAPDARAFALAAALLAERARSEGRSTLVRGWSSAAPTPAPMRVRAGEAERALLVVSDGAGRHAVTDGDRAETVEILAWEDARVRYRAGGVVRSAAAAFEAGVLHLETGGGVWAFEDVLLAPPQAKDEGGGGVLLAPMNGRVIAVRVAEGDRVSKGQRLVVIEAMKMEHEILAPTDGVVARVGVAPDLQVAAKDLLVEIKPDA